jgi:hypothetical protein
VSQSSKPEAFDVPGLGTITLDEELAWYMSEPVPVPILGRACQLILEGYAEDEHKEEFHAAIANFLGLTERALAEASEPLVRYYQDYEEYWLEEGKAPLRTAEELWAHVTLGHEPMVSRRSHGDRAIYVSVECGCRWEEEHGLQLVFRNGLRITRLGSYNGHLSNADAYADPQMEDVIYRSWR